MISFGSVVVVNTNLKDFMLLVGNLSPQPRRELTTVEFNNKDMTVEDAQKKFAEIIAKAD